ncbi:MAG: carboxypeptidase-like regulatory domain-containing protein, partial [Tannerella sp.]|nr:carboxypeptidase-like regulatory domain-containing protein [Tannerella sp.]
MNYKLIFKRMRMRTCLITGACAFFIHFVWAENTYGLSAKGEGTVAGVNSAAQQDRRVTGTVLDDTGEPLTGVSISIKGTTSGVISDIDGKYAIQVQAGSILVFSYIGYATQEVSVGNRSTIDITLGEDTQVLDEVVVVGYGTSKRSEITGAIASVGPKDFIKQQTFRATDALQGRVAGVQVTNTGGDPFSTVKIRIRGTNSINKGNDPLYVVNGVVGGSMPNVEEIESMEVLKDASATALYGSRGSNGVILITTKKGVAGKTTVTLDAYGTVQTPGKLYDKLDAASFAEAYNYTNNAKYFSNADIEDWRQTGGPDWQKEVLQNGSLQRYRLNISGGSDKVR